jgi:hypothetical protein
MDRSVGAFERAIELRELVLLEPARPLGSIEMPMAGWRGCGTVGTDVAIVIARF